MGNRHLFFLVHGLFGNATHMASMAEQLRQEFSHDKEIVVYCPTSNESMSTFDGVEKGADRLFEELFKKLDELVGEGHTVTKFSIVGYSLGGLFSRYLVGVLYECGFFETVRPMIFATFATPHAGTYFHSQRLQARVLNFFGSRILGYSGHDLFSASTLLRDLADPQQRYYKGLEKFEKLFLFANSINDRTVPFWTSYLSTKNPFRELEHTDLVFYNQKLVKSKNPDAKDPETAKPFLVAMDQSKYTTEPREVEPPSASAQRTKYIIMGLLPLIFPVMLSTLTTATLVSYAKTYMQQPTEINHRKLIAELEKKNAELEDQRASDPRRRHSSQGSHPGRRRSFSEEAEKEAASATGNVVENVLQLGDETEQFDVADMVLDGYPEPAVNGGFEGLIDSTPYELGISEEIRGIIDNLNTLPWNKYAVLIDFFNSHGEIVNRRKATGQGKSLQVFFSRMVAETLRKLEPSAVE